MRVDAHQHFWQRGRFDDAWMDAPGYGVLREDHLPERLASELELAGIDATVAVQTQHDVEETRWLLELAGGDPKIAGVVGWVDLTSEACEAQLRELSAHGDLVGIRHVTQDEPDDDFIVRPDVLRGLRVLEKHGMPFDLLVYVRQLCHAAPLAQALPDLPMVVDHLGKPDVAGRAVADWLPPFRAAARQPNVYCKLSGLVTEAEWKSWTSEDLKPYVQEALEAFGPQRCMFGSDWPVCRLAASYQRVVEALREALGDLASSDEERIFGGTAVEFYGLESTVFDPVSSS